MAHEPIGPIFPMMGVAAGMVLADVRKVAMVDTFFKYRRMVAVIVFGREEELLGTIFREVVLQTMPENPAFGAVINDAVTVAVNQTKMTEDMRHVTLPKWQRGSRRYPRG